MAEVSRIREYRGMKPVTVVRNGCEYTYQPIKRANVIITFTGKERDLLQRHSSAVKALPGKYRTSQLWHPRSSLCITYLARDGFSLENPEDIASMALARVREVLREYN